jgi:hypothetical protein
MRFVPALMFLEGRQGVNHVLGSRSRIQIAFAIGNKGAKPRLLTWAQGAQHGTIPRHILRREVIIIGVCETEGERRIAEGNERCCYRNVYWNTHEWNTPSANRRPSAPSTMLCKNKRAPIGKVPHGDACKRW